jgi:hypothetical protein
VTTKKALHEDLDAVDALMGKHFPLAKIEDEITVRVGSIAITAWIPCGFRDEILPRYQGFIWEGKGDFFVEAARDDDLGESLLIYPDVQIRSRPGRKIHYVFRWDFVARIDAEKQTASILIAPIGPAVCIDSLFRITTSFAAVDKGGFLLHAAAIATLQGGFLFCGISGSGKSTVAKMSQEKYDVITDEMALVEKIDDGYRIRGTPFWGQLQMSVNRSAPLRAVFLLSQASTSSVQDISIARAIPEFMKTVLYFGQNIETTDELLNVTLDFLGKVPIKTLSFVADRSMWEAIHEKFGK